MPIDSNIALGFKPHTEIQDPTNALAKFMQIQGLQQQNQLGQMKMDEHRSGVERTNRLNALMGQDYADDAARESAMIKGGFVDEAGKLGTQRRANQKSDLEHTAKRLELFGQGTGWVMKNPTMQNVQAMVNHWEQSGLVTKAEAQQKLAEFARDPTPEGIARYATMGYQAALSARDQLPSFETRNLGGTTDTLRRDPVTGAVTVVNSAKNSAAPGDLLAHDDRVKARVQADRHHTDTQGNLEYKQDAEGNWVALPKKAGAGPIVGAPVMGADGKPLAGASKTPMEFTKGMTGVNELNKALDTYEQVLKEVGGPDALALGEKRAKLQGAYTALKMGLKNAYELGALTGPDVGVLEGALVDPTSPKIMLTDIPAQITQTRSYLKNRESALETTYGKTNPAKKNAPTTPAAPTKISNDEQYAALKPGTEFVGPDGVTRRKP